MEAELEILIVDDEEIVGKRLGPALERSGYRVEVLQSGEAAIERLRQKHFDIVVSDIRMDEVDGLDVLEAAQQSSPGTQVILMTGYATMEVAREALVKGAFEFIAKPFQPKELRKLIEKAARELRDKRMPRA